LDDPALDPEHCYRALRSRDRRFDGRFFVGVRTTGIFCRPICPAPPPKSANCTYWLSAAAAQSAGFRPCLRCRPEAAPGTPAWSGTAASVSRALRLIEAGGLDGEGSVDELAERLGMGPRHLRRLFDQHLGATPLAVAKMRRTLFAKQLIDETALSMTEVALSAGFSSQRRFNACMQEVYRRPPSELRRQCRGARPARGKGVGKGKAKAASAERTKESEEPNAIELSLPYRPPLAWEELLGFFEPRAIPGVEHVEGGRYFRTIRSTGGIGSIAVGHDEAKGRLRVAVRTPSSEGLIETSTRLRQLFDLDADAETIDAALAEGALFHAHVASRPGMRVPGAFDGFETAVRGILGQQISVKGATTLAGRIAERWGKRLPRRFMQHEALHFAFPGPKRLLSAELEEVGIIRARADTIRGLARAVLDDPTLLQPGPGLEADLERWVALPGIGPWTAHYVSMRVLREPDALPAADLGLRKAISASDDALRPARDVEAALEACRPYRAYAAMRLWAML
jgi:AraC family transcriptional regulator, regulatory protein of adaptative response / DNA-3-methyladenine glycosylase II